MKPYISLAIAENITGGTNTPANEKTPISDAEKLLKLNKIISDAKTYCDSVGV